MLIQRRKKLFFLFSNYSQIYKKAAIFYFSYYEYVMKCPELNIEITRKENDFYFLRDLLLKIYPATIVRINYI